MSLQIIKPAPEGFGSLFQLILSSYLLAREHGLHYKYLPLIFEHVPKDTGQEDWDIRLNNAAKNLLPSNNIDYSTLPVYSVVADKIHLNRRIHSEDMTLIRDEYWKLYPKSLTSIPQVVIHLRCYSIDRGDNPTMKEAPGYYTVGSDRDNEIQGIIKQLRSMGSFQFIILADGNLPEHSIEHYKAPDTVFRICCDLLDDIRLMFTSDILVVSRSSFSMIGNYYTKGITVASNWTLSLNLRDTETEPLIHINRVFTDKDKEKIHNHLVRFNTRPIEIIQNMSQN